MDIQLLYSIHKSYSFLQTATSRLPLKTFEEILQKRVEYYVKLYMKNVLQNRVTATVWKEMIGYGLEKDEKMLIKYLKKEGGRLFTIDNGLLPDEGNKAVYMCLRKYFSTYSNYYHKLIVL